MSPRPLGRVLVLACAVLVIESSAQSPASADAVVRAARDQVGVTLGYDGRYLSLAYPMGDADLRTGVCTDVVVRALRKSHGMDLQRLVHEDMKKSFASYPQKWGLRRPDANIDHRRVPNLQTFFTRQGWALPLDRDASRFRPGDLVTSIIPPNLPHIMVVSDRRRADGRPWVIHNIGGGVQEEDRLFEFRLTGHYRLP